MLSGEQPFGRAVVEDDGAVRRPVLDHDGEEKLVCGGGGGVR